MNHSGNAAGKVPILVNMLLETVSESLVWRWVVIDQLSLLIGGALVSVGWLLGRLRARGSPETTNQLAMMCSCGHGYGKHANMSSCSADVERAHYLLSGARNGFEWVRCSCASYDGPEPLPRVWSNPGEL